MPKAHIKVGDFSDVDAAEGFADYEGPVPPRGLYLCVVKFWRLVTNSNGDPMFKLLLLIDEPKGSPKARFNGYAIWHNANLTDKGAPFANAMLDAFGLNRRAVWQNSGAGIIVAPDDDERVVKIAGRAVDGAHVVVNSKRGSYNGDPKLEAQGFIPAENYKVPDAPSEDDGTVPEDESGSEDDGAEDWSNGPDAF